MHLYEGEQHKLSNNTAVVHEHDDTWGRLSCTIVILSHGGARDDTGKVGRQEKRRVADVVVVEVLQRFEQAW